MENWALRKYGEVYENWPRDDRDQPIAPAHLKRCSPLDLEAEMLQSMLQAYGIPSFRCLPGDGQFGQLIIGMSGSGVDIFVPGTLLEQAQELMEGEAEHDQLEEGI